MIRNTQLLREKTFCGNLAFLLVIIIAIAFELDLVLFRGGRKDGGPADP